MSERAAVRALEGDAPLFVAADFVFNQIALLFSHVKIPNQHIPQRVNISAIISLDTSA